MAMTVSSGQTTINGSVTTTIASTGPPSTAAGAVLVKLSPSLDGATTVTIGTVPAGKTWYITGIAVSTYSTAADTVNVINDGTNILGVRIAANTNGQMFFNLAPYAITVAATKALTMSQSNAGTHTYASIFYNEV